MSTEEVTGTPNVVYNLISVIYHALQAAETYAEYIRDAEERNDTAAADFFREVQEQNKWIADKGEQLLAERLSR